jgi:hypothetical protein
MQPLLLSADLHIYCVVIVTTIQTDEKYLRSKEVNCGPSWPVLG